MCMKYKVEYQACFDHLFISPDEDMSLVLLLQEQYNTKIVKFDEFQSAVMELLARFHEEGVIAPYGPTAWVASELPKP